MPQAEAWSIYMAGEKKKLGALLINLELHPWGDHAEFTTPAAPVALSGWVSMWCCERGDIFSFSGLFGDLNLIN